MQNIKTDDHNQSVSNSSTVVNNADTNNVFYSPSFAHYFLNNWCGLIPLWTSLHLGDQGRHGTSSVYQMWSGKFSHLPCVKDPPRTQGIVEFHQKSVKHITLNSRRERVDSVIKNLFIAKKSKFRQLEISKSRKKPIHPQKEEKVKDTLPSKIASEKWSKRKHKQSGTGFFQTNKVSKIASKQLEDWEKLQVIPWGGNYTLPTGQTVRLYSTCAIDTFLEIIFFFYSLNLHQMKNLFDCEEEVVKNICDVVQLLLTNDFIAAKFNWLTSICRLSPDDSGLLNSFGTDKQLIMYHIKYIFQRRYEFTCSSENCPSRICDAKKQIDIVDDMTLHTPNALQGDKNAILKSIELWELGMADAAAISCKELFVSEPEHSNFFTEKDNGKDVIRCSGWRKPKYMTFLSPPPFLIFDISIDFRETIRTLDVLPLDIWVYGERYRLGGITSYVNQRKHYVGYIVNNENFLFYDGIPSDNPVLKTYSLRDIEGDISLLCFFPCDGKSNELIKPIITSISEGVCNNDTASDFLLAQAISTIENEKKNEYERPKGKNYRRAASKHNSCPVNTSSSQGNNKSSFTLSQNETSLPFHSRENSASSDSDDNSEINTELIEFIGKKKDLILKLVSDPSYSSEYHIRSERLMALRRCNSLKSFEKNALIEAGLICSQMKEYVGSGVHPCEPYISHIFSKILTEKKDPDPDDICDYGGYFPVPIKIRKFNDIFKTIEFIIFPEVITEFVMETKKLSYEKASLILYENATPVSHGPDHFIRWSSFE